MTTKRSILIVDDTPANIKILNDLLRDEYKIIVATNGPDALEIVYSKDQPDLILLDIMMPNMDGYEVCHKLKQSPNTSNIPVLFVTAKDNVADETKGLEMGVEDYITKPFIPPIVKQRIRNHMALHLHHVELEQLVEERTKELRNGYIDMIQRLTLTSEYKDEETGAHIRRIGYYCKELSRQMGFNSEFIEAIYHASPMHDIGKVAIPDSILLKQGPLNQEEWETMKTHAEIGALILDGGKSPLIKMACEIAGCHHERWNGGGYPNGLKMDKIPITARIMTITDQYDALRSKRPYKPAFNHNKALEIITKGDGRTMPDHFDPDVLAAFNKIADIFEDIFETHNDKEQGNKARPNYGR